VAEIEHSNRGVSLSIGLRLTMVQAMQIWIFQLAFVISIEWRILSDNSSDEEEDAKITMTVIMISPWKRGNIGDKGTSKMPPTMPTERQLGELRYEKTIAAAIKTEELLEQPMTFYPFTKDTTILSLITMMNLLQEEVPPSL
jgi:hypothetical protein